MSNPIIMTVKSNMIIKPNFKNNTYSIVKDKHEVIIQFKYLSHKTKYLRGYER